MPRRKQTKGRCTYCAAEALKGGMPKHLSACPQRLVAIDKAEQAKGSRKTLYHLRVQDAWGGDFWLDLETRGSATLGDLDDYLRRIWLECCGHLSQFSVGGWRGDEIDMRQKIGNVFAGGVELTHIYDFGSSSETLVKAVAVREGKPTTNHPLALMARNLIPEAECIECGQPAAWFCEECMIEDETSGMLCDGHAKTHPHENYGEPMGVVNSPRLGLCGYNGPAEPPY